MRKPAAVIVYALLFVAIVSLLIVRFQRRAGLAATGTVADLDAWRHYLLHTAAFYPAVQATADPDGPINAARQFKTEYEKAIAEFNTDQENRSTAERLPALHGFVTRRDALVQSYKDRIKSAITPQAWIELSDAVEQSKAGMKSTVTCSSSNFQSCMVSYSMYPVETGMAPDRTPIMGFNQVLDGEAPMIHDFQGTRHTPTVTWTVEQKRYEDSGKSVCPECYLYVNATVSLGGGRGVGFGGDGEGVVVCTEMGKFFDAHFGGTPR